MLAVVTVAAVQAYEIAWVHVPASPPGASVIPAGACVVTDQVSLAIAAGRFGAAHPGCPDVLDSLATTLVLSGGVSVQGGAGRQPRVISGWERILGQGSYVWLSSGSPQRIPWTATLRAWFAGHFRPVTAFHGYADSRLYVPG